MKEDAMKKILFAALLVLLASTGLQAQVSTSTVAPTTDILSSQTNGGAQYLVDTARDPGQGQTFTLPNTIGLEAITVQIGTDGQNTQGTMEDAAALSLNLYQVGPGSPLAFATPAILRFNDPTAVPFDASNANTTPLYLTFNLPSPERLDCNVTYAFTITSSSMTDRGFRIERSTFDAFPQGNGIFTGGNNVPTLRADDDAVFFLQGILLGDVTGDGAVNFFDISMFLQLLIGGGFSPGADLDFNGIIDFGDIAPFISVLQC